MARRVFISHAFKDKPVIDAFSDMLQTGLGILYTDIFCSSLDGLGIPKGSKFVEYIEKELAEADFVIVCLSQHSLMSQFCQCELGAVWAIKQEIFPILIPPTTYEDVKGIMVGMQLGMIDNKADLNELRDKLTRRLALENGSTARWDIKSDGFLSNLPGLLKLIPAAETVKKVDFDVLTEKYQDAVRYGTEVDRELSNAKKRYEELSRLKDAQAVSDYEWENSTDREKFGQLVKQTRAALDKLDNIVRFMILKDFMGEDQVRFKVIDENERYEAACEAAENKYLRRDENLFWLNEHDPTVQKAKDACRKLSHFLENEAEDATIEILTTEDGFAPELDNKRFWETYLGLHS